MKKYDIISGLLTIIFLLLLILLFTEAWAGENSAGENSAGENSAAAQEVSVSEPVDTLEIDWNDPDVQRDIYEDWGCFYDIPFSWDLQVYIGEMARDHNVDRLLVFAIAGVESEYGTTDNTNIMQISSYWQNAIACHKVYSNNTYEPYTTWDLSNEYDNLHMAICILDHYQRMGYSGDALLMCYNGNSGYANDLIAQGITQTAYTKKVMKIYRQLEKELLAQAAKADL